MKHNYKIRLDEPVPSDDQIDRHKNFDRLLADHRNITEPLYNRPLYRNPKAFIGLMLILVITFLVFRAVEEEEAIDSLLTELDAEAAREKAFLQPSLPVFKPLASEFQVEPGEESVFELPSGTLMRIPATAYASQTAPINMSVIEITDPLQAALAGIPMDGETAGNMSLTQIIQVTASVGGQPIEPDPGAYLAFEKSGPRNPETEGDVLYLLDPDDRQWKPAQEEISLQERRNQPNHPKVNLNDGFNMVEFNDSGSIRNRPEEIEENEAHETINWVRSFEAGNNGYYLCGKSQTAFSPNLKLRFQSEDKKPLPLAILYQVQIEGESVHTYFPLDSKFTFEVFVSSENHKFFGFDAKGHLIWADAQAPGSEMAIVQPQKSNETVSNLEQIKTLLALPVK